MPFPVLFGVSPLVSSLINEVQYCVVECGSSTTPTVLRGVSARFLSKLVAFPNCVLSPLPQNWETDVQMEISSFMSIVYIRSNRVRLPTRSTTR
ncbi:hypothetical protein BKA60DRAFT_22839 [Fusarium oxysporum]|nr:hypothetical protein BKA60DRAFT_22839 [Fusarium oxysporum]